MAIKVRLTGNVSDAPRSLTFTPSGTPRFSFCVRVGGLRKRTYRVTAYGTQARFGDRHLHFGDRVQIEGAYLRRSQMVEAQVRADTIRHVGRSTPPHLAAPVKFAPTPPPLADTMNSSKLHESTDDPEARAYELGVNDTIAALA